MLNAECIMLNAECIMLTFGKKMLMEGTVTDICASIHHTIAFKGIIP